MQKELIAGLAQLQKAVEEDKYGAGNDLDMDMFRDDLDVVLAEIEDYENDEEDF